LAAAEKVWHRPSGDSPPNLDMASVLSGDRIRFTPPTRAIELSASRRLFMAWCTATREDEQAVLTTKLGPLRPSTYDTLPASTLVSWPIALCCSSPPSPSSVISRA
jgi:hypothetical protein